jgi:hypothetical protein
MAIVSINKDDMKSDVKELVDIVIEDKIFKEKIEEYRYCADIDAEVTGHWNLCRQSLENMVLVICC